MKGDKIPDEDHVSRFCKKQTVPNGTLQATAFLLRDGEEYLSVNWLEYFGCSSRDLEIGEVRNVLASKLRLRVGEVIAVVNVGHMRDYVSEILPGRHIRVIHEPEDPIDQSHSGIYGVREDNELIAELILETIQETYPARQ